MAVSGTKILWTIWVRGLRPVYAFALHMIDRVIGLLPAVEKPGTVLVVRSDNLGDFLLWLETAKGLRDLYPAPAYRITLAVKSNWAGLAGMLPYWDDIRPIEYRSMFWKPLYRLGFLFRLRREGYEIAVNAQFTHDGYWGDSIVRASGARVRVGMAGSTGGLSACEFHRVLAGYTRLIECDPARLFESDRNMSLLLALGGTQPRTAPADLSQLCDGPSDRLAPDYFIVAPGTEQPGRRWPEDRFARILAHVQERTGWQAVLVGTSGERPIAEALLGCLNGEEVVDLVGETSLTELFSLIRHARILVGNDSGSIHVAAAVGTPAFAVLGGGQYGRFLPYGTNDGEDGALPESLIHKMECFGCDWRCIYPVEDNEPYPCVSGVNEAAFAALIDRAIDAGR